MRLFILPGRFAIACACFFLAVASTAQQSSLTNEYLHVEPVPNWVDVQELQLAENVPIDEIQDGVFYQLLDGQIKVERDGARSTHRRYVETVVNQTGVESSSQINVSFDPSYHRLALNSLFVIRDGQKLDRLNDAKMSIISRETELDNQIYNGKLTLNVLLDDVQAGDTLDYSYTREGSNPVYKNLFSTGRNLNWSVPVYRQNLRVLWGKETPLTIDFRNIDVPLIETKKGRFTEYRIELQEQEIVDSPSEAPAWYSPFGGVYFNEIKSWQEVVAWAEPMYQFGAPPAEVGKIASEIRRTTSTKAEQIAAALKYTQSTIRYVGLEMGQNSHLPRSPEQTLSLKYGDCKDKATLLVSLLAALGIEAHPALVDTDDTKLIAELPIGVNLFNHVIVWLQHEGEDVWLDPTLSNQAGSLENLYQPDYGYALVLEKGTDALRSMERDVVDAFTEVAETYAIPASDEEPVTFAVSTRYKGYEAIRKLWQLERDGKSGVADDYEVYYQRSFPNLRLADELVIENDDSSGVLVIDERYEISPFWTVDKNKLEADFYAEDIRGAVFKPEESTRNGPLWFEYPNEIRSSVTLTFEEDDWNFTPKQFDEDNDFFTFSSDISFTDNVLALRYEFRSKTDHIPEDRINDYLEARERVIDNTYYGIYKTTGGRAEPADDVKKSSGRFDIDWSWVLGIGFLLASLYVLIDWQVESRKRPRFEGSEFYPIALWKLVIMSVVTFSIYNYYWMYRNWKAIKHKTGQSMMPFWRAMFACFWVYPLFGVLRKDSEDAYQANRVCAPWLAVVITLLFLLYYVFSGGVNGPATVAMYVLLPLVLTPFVHYIESRNEQAPEALHFNTQWRARQIVTALLAAPILFIQVSGLNLIPSDSVVTQDKLLQRDLKYFYRQKLVKPGEDIVYFYSDAFINIRADGNGFTDERVFSYWEEDGERIQEVALFEDISDVEVEFAESFLENTIITITRSDGSDFLLFVTDLDGGDVRFVDELKARWDARREAPVEESESQ